MIHKLVAMRIYRYGLRKPSGGTLLVRENESEAVLSNGYPLFVLYP